MPTSMSVIIPTHNRSTDLERALESLAAQTRLPDQVIVCDDGSEEDIRRVVDRFTSRLHVAYIRISKSGGPGRPRNVALASATESWVSFLDSDDWWDPNRIEALQAVLKEPVDVVYHRLRMVYEKDPPAGQKKLHLVGHDCGPDPLRTMVTQSNPIPTSAAVARRARLIALGGITEDFATVEDFDTWLRIGEAGGVFRYVDLVLGSYTVSGANMSAFSEKQLRRMRTLFDHHLPLLPEALRSAASSHFSYVLGTYCYRLGMRPDADRYLSQVQRSESLPEWARAQLRRVALRNPLVQLLRT